MDVVWPFGLTVANISKFIRISVSALFIFPLDKETLKNYVKEKNMIMPINWET